MDQAPHLQHANPTEYIVGQAPAEMRQDGHDFLGLVQASNNCVDLPLYLGERLVRCNNNWGIWQTKRSLQLRLWDGF